MFDLPAPEQNDTTEKIYNELKKIKIYDKNKIFKSNENKNELTYIGGSLSVIDTMTKNHNNLLSLCIDEINDIYFLKILIILYENYINYFIINQNKDLLNNKEKYKEEQDKLYFSFVENVFNKQYGKNKETLLIKSIKKSNLEIFKFLLNDINFNNCKINLDIYKTDFNGQNILHYAVQLKQKETILFLVKYDADYNKLILNKNIKGKIPADFDRTKSFENELCSVWDAAKNNDIKMLDKLINELKYYDINQQTCFKGNTPLHIAVKNMADKSVLFLVLNGANKNIKNKKLLTPFENIKNDKNIDKKWIKKVKKILDGKIKNYVDLDTNNFDKLVKNEEIINFTKKIDLVNGNIKKIYNEKKEKNENELGKLSFGISTNSRLRELLSIIIENIRNKKINVEDLIKNYDKNNSGKIGSNEFNKFIASFDIEIINYKDEEFIKSFLEKDINGLIQYMEFIELIKN